jgi:hypothetical protein
VVNPSGVSTPTVGWKQAPVSTVAPIFGVISDIVFYVLHLEIHILIYIYSQKCEMVNNFSVRMSVQCFDNN